MTLPTYIPDKTADGSPTLRDAHTKEPMHNLAGAFGESLYVYLEAIKQYCYYSPPQPPLKVLSIGLGLAYNEIINIAYLKKSSLCDFKIRSYEKDSALIKSLRTWCLSKDKNFTGGILAAYEDILMRTAQEFSLSSTELKSELRNAIDLEKWSFHGPLLPSTSFSEKFHCIFYDPFSENTDPDLWKEEYLNTLIEKSCEEECVFTTYAAKGALSRVLKKHGFIVVKRPGFGRKKECTFATRRRLS